jgi:curved DNA-binding protein CbpA
MSEFEDYYDILGISENASTEDIKKAYRDQCFILHPDRLVGAPESARTRAEEMLKRINRAYDVLSDPAKRHSYDSQWQQRSPNGQQTSPAKPKPVVEPQSIRFANVEPGETKTASFTIRNQGGPCSRIWFNTPDSWLKVVSWASLTDSNELPLQVHIEATGDSWGKVYAESIKVKLDDEQAEVRIELRTRPERGKASSGSISKGKPASAGAHGASNRNAAKWATGLVCCALLVGIAGLFLQAPKAHRVTATQPVAIQTHRRAMPSAIHDGDWLPNCSGIVASSQSQTVDRHSRYRLYITGADGTDKRELNIGKAAPNTASEDYVAPLASPDGRRIAFVVDRHDHLTAMQDKCIRRGRL